MARSKLLGWLSHLVALIWCAQAVVADSSIISFAQGSDGYTLAGPGLTPEIRVAPNDYAGVARVASDLAADFGRVTGVNGTVITADWTTTSAVKNSSQPIIIIGTVGKSSLLDGLTSSGRLNTSGVAGKWETFSYQVVPAPWPGQDAVFVISGSDLQGTVFGTYDVSEQIGVSPWYWWADVAPAQHKSIYASSSAVPYAAGPPSVKFRGIFFNDESPCLTGWGHANFKNAPSGSPFVGDFYKRVFELVLRLKANYLWPAMWQPAMFYVDDANNGPNANLYGVYMGTSHTEPMARSDEEHSKYLKGAWDWKSNKAGVQTFMQDGVTRSANWSTVYTVGMRGSGDAASPTLDSKTLEEVISWQQATLTKTLGKDLSQIPQAWVMYKEVPGYWQNGMSVSDEITLLWSDDNRGNIRRVPNATEVLRKGGSGMYYHFDYVGDPRNYKWINTIQLQKTWEQMTLAYDRGVQNIWIANVGDLKGLELPTAHFLAMAWNRNSFSGLDSTTQWLQSWATQQFGADAANATASIMNTYGKLTARRKYEDLSNSPFAFNTVNYDEAELNYNEWAGLVDQAQAVYDSLTSAVQASFFEVVLHPVLAGKTVYEIYTKAAVSSKYANEHRVSGNQVANDAKAAFTADAAISKRYNTLLNGKWNHMMDQIHIGYTTWQDPSANTMPKVTYVTSSTTTQSARMGVFVQGSSTFFPTASILTTLAINPYTPAVVQPWLEVFARDNGTFSYQITSNASYVSVTNAQQTITAPGTASDIRSVLSVDWASAPAGHSVAALAITNLNATGAKATVNVPLDNVALPSGFKGHVEYAGAVSIEAEHYDAASSGSGYLTVAHYGRTLSGVKFAPTAPSQGPGAGPALAYPFYTVLGATAATVTVYLSSSENSVIAQPNRYSFSVDGGQLTTVQPTPSLANLGDEPTGWSDAVIQNAWVKTSSIGKLSAGAHVLKLYLLEPTMVVTKIVIDVGGLKSSALGPPESTVVG